MADGDPSLVPFNRPFIAGKELYYIAQAVALGNISGDGQFTKRCARILEREFGVHRALMTPSCTASLEMAAMLCGLKEGDEVIMPSFTFVSTANAVVLQRARPVFVDIRSDTLNLDENLIERAITPRTRAIFPVHYAGVSCEMDTILDIARRHKLRVVEDAAQGVNARYRGRGLGSLGDLAAYSFHETKNYICGEGGALCINDPELVERAEIIRDKGTNRSKFFRGEVDKYTWVDVGSSYVPSEINCAFLYAQLELLEAIANRRRAIYKTYEQLLTPLAEKELLRLPVIPPECEPNYHMYYAIVRDAETRDALLKQLKSRGVNALFHYVPLHSAPKGRSLSNSAALPVTESHSSRLVRLPFFFEITQSEQQRVVDEVKRFFEVSA